METKLYILLLAVTFLSSLKSLRLDIIHYKVITLVLACDLVAELISYRLNQIEQNNMLVSSLTLLIEFWLYGFYYHLIIANRTVRKLIRIYLGILPVAWIILVLVIFHDNKWNSPFFVLGSVPTVLLSAIYYYQLFTAEKLTRLTASFEFWVATALILYFAGSLPYFGMLNYLNTNFKVVAQTFLTLAQILNYIFYAILLYAYIWAIPIKK